MSTESRVEDLHKVIFAAQDRFNYFFLAASGSAIAFALLQTERQGLTRWMLPVALAVLLWGLSFFSGAQHLRHKISFYLANLKWLGIQEGTDAATTVDPELREEALASIKTRADRLNDRSALYGRWQFYLFFAGACFYVIGHVLRILEGCRV